MTDELQKITMNFYKTDIDDLEHIFGYGWSVQVREWVHEKIKLLTKRPPTVGDILNDR